MLNGHVALLLLLTSSLLSCQTTPTKFDELQKGRWTSKVLVRNHKDSKSAIVNLDIVAIRPSRFRIEVTTPIGIHLASLVLDQNEFRGALIQQKKFIIGQASEKSFTYVLGVSLDPYLMMNLLFDEAPSGPAWNCSKDKNDFMSVCENKTQKIKVTWKDREVSRRKIEIETRMASLQMVLQGFSTKVEENAEMFTLEPPDGFKIERIK